MKEFLSIGEFAKIKNVTTETLRHYDRIGLLKPVYKDDRTNYRYYSIFQYEKLSTILELRQLGVKLEDIKKFFEKRDPETSLKLLKTRYELLEQEYNNLKLLKEKLSKKIAHVEYYLNKKSSFDLDIKYLEERCILSLNKMNSLEYEYSFSKFESNINEISPIFAENRYLFKIEYSELLEKDQKIFPMMLIDNDFDYSKIEKSLKRDIIPAGKYASVYFYGYNYDVLKILKDIADDLIKKGYKNCNELIFIPQLDIPVVENVEKIFFEVQFFLNI